MATFNDQSVVVYQAFRPAIAEEAAAEQRFGDQFSLTIQWDPDTDPFGQPLARRSLQIGLRGPTLVEYAEPAIVAIGDITRFVHDQHRHVASHHISGPLAQFQAKKLTRAGIGEVVHSLQASADTPIPDERTRRTGPGVGSDDR